MRVAKLIVAGLAVGALATASTAAASGSTPGGSTGSTPGGSTGSGSTGSTGSPTPPAPCCSGGVGFVPGPPPPSTPLHPVVKGFTAKVVRGLAYAPSYAPIQVQRAIWAGDLIRVKPYIYSGGHAKWNDMGYDCSGSVSYVLHAAGLLNTSRDSSEFMGWGQSGHGAWITVYSNPGHAFIEIAGIRLDTSAEQDPHPAPGSGPRWRPLVATSAGYVARHPLGF